MTQPVLTTGGPPPTGFNGVALIFAQLVMGFEPAMVMATKPNALLKLAVTPSIQMLPPQEAPLLFSPTFVMRAGTEETTSFRLSVTPVIRWIPCVAVHLSVTPALSMSAKAIVRGRQIHVAVTRAATH
jgi:hypothetical protein